MSKRSEALELVQSNAIWNEQCEVVSMRPYTLVRRQAEINGKVYTGVGMAKQGHKDTWNSKIGLEVAAGRAWKDIARKAGLIK